MANAGAPTSIIASFDHVKILFGPFLSRCVASSRMKGWNRIRVKLKRVKKRHKCRERESERQSKRKCGECVESELLIGSSLIVVVTRVVGSSLTYFVHCVLTAAGSVVPDDEAWNYFRLRLQLVVGREVDSD